MKFFFIRSPYLIPKFKESSRSIQSILNLVEIQYSLFKSYYYYVSRKYTFLPLRNLP